MRMGSTQLRGETAPGPDAEFLRGGGEMGRRIRTFDWSVTPLREPGRWPASLRTAVRIMLTSRQPKFVWWGEELINLYNDPYAGILGARHPQALGRPAAQIWREIWDEIGPRARHVVDRDEGVFEESLPLLLERNGYPEETYFTFSYSPIPGDGGRPGGIICACVEDTRRIIGEQQLALQQVLAERIAAARTAAEACEGAAAALGAHPQGMPFALLYLVDADGGRARLAGCTGLEPGTAAAPEWLALDAPPWTLAAVLERGRPQIVDLAARDVPAGDDPQRHPRRALLMPITAPGERQPVAVLVAALNPYRICGVRHRRFMEVIASQIASGLVKALAYEAEARRAETLARLRADAEILVDLAQEIGAELDLMRLVQKVADAGVRLTGAAYGAFFHNAGDAPSPGELQHALSGEAGGAFAHIGLMRSTEPFATTYSGTAVVRCDDLTRHPARAADRVPEVQALVRSYLAVPVRSRSGRVLGGLFFGHPRPGVFDERAERLAVGIAAQAGVAIDNAHAYQDVTEAIERSIHSENAYRSSERRYRELINAMPIAVYTCDAQGVVTLYNRAASELWGRAPRIGEDLWCGSYEIFSPEDGARLPLDQCPMAQALRTGRAIHGAEIVVGRPDGARRHVLVYPRPLTDDQGGITGAINILVDVSDQKQKERALRRSEQLYRAIGESIDFGVWICDAQGRNVYASDSFLRLVGMTQEQFGDLGWLGALHPEEREATRTAWRACVEAGGNWDREYRARSSGGWHPVLARGVVLRDERGAVTGWAGIHLDIERLKRVEDELRQGDQRKNEFLAILAHELRNPLAPIRNGIEVLKRVRPDGDAAVQARVLMERQVRNMVRLVDDLLDLSRITRGLVDLRRAPLDVRAVLGAAVDACRSLAESAGHELQLDLPDAPAETMADATRLEQVFSNLISNAVRYTPAAGLIRLQLLAGDDEIVVHVSDNGIGIPDGMHARIFEMFTQADRSIERSTGGLGIGLTLVQRLVAMHGGTVEALSAGAGKGSEFIVRLPRLRVAAALPPAERSVEPAASAAQHRWRILVVDDHVDAAASLALMLGIRGDEVRVAHNGVEAIAAVRSFRPQLVLMDIGMPVLNGFEACRSIRALEGGDAIVIVALTGWGQAEDRERTREAGFDEHWVKPVNVELVERMIATLPQRIRHDAAASAA